MAAGRVLIRAALHPVIKGVEGRGAVCREVVEAGDVHLNSESWPKRELRNQTGHLIDLIER